jgi:hypothetical protein
MVRCGLGRAEPDVASSTVRISPNEDTAPTGDAHPTNNDINNSAICDNLCRIPTAASLVIRTIRNR